MESRALLFKDWSRFRGADRIKDIQVIDMVLTSQLKALEELKLESEELYQAAIQVIYFNSNNFFGLIKFSFFRYLNFLTKIILKFQIDPGLVPFTIKGPVHTPPINGFDAPDGEYVDISKNWYEMPKLG